MSEGSVFSDIDQITLYTKGAWSIVYVCYNHSPEYWNNPKFVDLMYEDENVTLMRSMGGGQDYPPIPDDVYQKYKFWKSMML